MKFEKRKFRLFQLDMLVCWGVQDEDTPKVLTEGGPLAGQSGKGLDFARILCEKTMWKSHGTLPISVDTLPKSRALMKGLNMQFDFGAVSPNSSA